MHDWHQRKVAMVVGRHLGINAEEITLSSKLETDLGLDPLDLVLISLRLEEDAEEVESPFPVEALQGVETVGQLTDVYREWVTYGERIPSTRSGEFYTNDFKRRRLRCSTR